MERPRSVWISVSCHVKWDLFWVDCEVREVKTFTQNFTFKSLLSSASHHLLIFLPLCMPVSVRLFCDRISLFSHLLCSTVAFLLFLVTLWLHVCQEEIAWSQQRTKWLWPLFRMRYNSLKIFSRIMDHWFDQLLSAFVFIYINVTNCYSPCTVMKATDIHLHGLLNRSIVMCRTESSVLWVILAKSSCCLVLDVCVSGCLNVQRPPPLTEQSWAYPADWGALILLIHLGLQCFVIPFNYELYLC